MMQKGVSEVEGIMVGSSKEELLVILTEFDRVSLSLPLWR